MDLILAAAEEEIQAEALVRNLPAFSRFLEIAALMHAQVLNVNSLARDAGVQRTTVNSYLEVLEDTLIATRLPAFEAKLRARERAHPKWYLFDSGVVRALKRQLESLTHEERGALCEGLVLHVLRAHLANHQLDGHLAYWATPGAEVDFILSLGKKRYAFDVTSSERLHEADFRGLRAIVDLPKLANRTLVYAGAREYETEDGIVVLPFPAFISQVNKLQAAIRGGTARGASSWSPVGLKS